MSLTREQILADPLWRAVNGLPPLPRRAPSAVPSVPPPVPVQIPAWNLPLITPVERPADVAPAVEPFDVLAVDPSTVTPEQLNDMFRALKK